MPLQFSLEDLTEGKPSDQLRETVGQVNLLLRQGSITEQEAWGLILAARRTEILSHHAGVPLEEGSAQTPDVEARRVTMLNQARK